MLGYVVTEARGASDRLLADVVRQLSALGIPLAGAVQVNGERGRGRRCDMEIEVIGEAERIGISQDLGRDARGCRLDPDGLERVVALIERRLDAAPAPRLLVLNKFGKQEAEGRGFRTVIGRALAEGIPVLTSVNQRNLPAFEDFADGLATRIDPSAGAVVDWCRAALAPA